MDTQQSQSNQTQFDQYIQELIDQKYIQKGHKLEPEVIEELKKDIIRQLDQFIMARVIASLSDEDVQALEKLMQETKSVEEAHKFAAEHVPDFTSFLTDVLLEFQQVYLG